MCKAQNKFQSCQKTQYSKTINNLKVTGKLADRKDNTEDFTFDSHKAVEAEAAVTQGEVERRKPLTAAEKRRRNETLAIGISRTELLKNNGSSERGMGMLQVLIFLLFF